MSTEQGNWIVGPRKGYTLTEFIVVVVMVLLLGGALAWSVRTRLIGCEGIAVRSVCAGSGLRAIGTSCKIYANENDGWWPTPAFDETRIGSIDYTIPAGSGFGSVRSPNRWQPSLASANGTRQLSTSRALWMLIRQGEIVPLTLICPESGHVPEDTTDISAQFDVSSLNNISYGIQVPFGHEGTRPSDNLDPRMAVVADRGPYVSKHVLPPNLTVNAPAEDWRRYNSPNHGGEGQNVLFGDGHVEWKDTPIVGRDHDNIYTVATDDDTERGRVNGESPWARSAPPLTPTVAILGNGDGTAFDSVIFP